MNCANCGTEIEFGFLCKKCEDTAAQGVIDRAKKESNEKRLSPREAILAMLDGATLVSPNGCKVKWVESDGGFVDEEERYRYCFKSFSYQSSKLKTRPMDTFECLAWVNSPDSIGWMVSCKNTSTIEEFGEWGRWDIPQRFRYDGKRSYRRARVLPDKSGIDESTIQGFLVEVV